jgi:hypothetical protein
MYALLVTATGVILQLGEHVRVVISQRSAAQQEEAAFHHLLRVTCLTPLLYILHPTQMKPVGVRHHSCHRAKSVCQRGSATTAACHAPSQRQRKRQCYHLPLVKIGMRTSYGLLARINLSMIIPQVCTEAGHKRRAAAVPADLAGAYYAGVARFGERTSGQPQDCCAVLPHPGQPRSACECPALRLGIQSVAARQDPPSKRAQLCKRRSETKGTWPLQVVHALAVITIT